MAKAVVCKTIIPQFDSGRRLHYEIQRDSVANAQGLWQHWRNFGRRKELTLVATLERLLRFAAAKIRAASDAYEDVIKTQIDIIMRAALKILHSGCHMRTDNDA